MLDQHGVLRARLAALLRVYLQRGELRPPLGPDALSPLVADAGANSIKVSSDSSESLTSSGEKKGRAVILSGGDPPGARGEVLDVEALPGLALGLAELHRTASVAGGDPLRSSLPARLALILVRLVKEASS